MKNSLLHRGLCSRGLRAAMLIAVSLLLFSCSMFEDLSDTDHEVLEFEFPSWPENLPPLLEWKVQMYVPKTGELLEQDYSPEIRSFSHKVCKNVPLYVCAEPITGSPDSPQAFFKCSGAVYPWECSGKKSFKVNLSWTGGYVCCLMKTMIKSMEKNGENPDDVNRNLQAFNWYKLSQVLIQKEQEQAENEIFYNPWLLDSQKVLEAIAYKDFTATKLRQSGVFPVNFEFNVYSSYVPENINCFTQNNGGYVSVKKEEPLLVGLPDKMEFGLIIYGSSEKNISLEFISMPIYIEGI